MLVFLAGIVGFCLSGDLFNMFVFYELFSVAAYALAGYRTTDPGSVRGALNFAITNSVGAILVLSGIALLYGRTGALNLAQLGQSLAAGPADRLVVVAFLLLMVGFFVKAAVVPFHFWLADAYALAPIVVGVLFAGVVSELGLYAVARVYWTVFSAPLAGVEGLSGVLLRRGRGHRRRRRGDVRAPAPPGADAGVRDRQPRRPDAGRVRAAGAGRGRGRSAVPGRRRAGQGSAVHLGGHRRPPPARRGRAAAGGQGPAPAVGGGAHGGRRPRAGRGAAVRDLPRQGADGGGGPGDRHALDDRAVRGGLGAHLWPPCCGRSGRVFLGLGQRQELGGHRVPWHPRRPARHPHVHATQVAPAVLLLAGALAVGLAPGVTGAVEEAADRFTDRPAYVAVVLGATGDQGPAQSHPPVYLAGPALWAALSIAARPRAGAGRAVCPTGCPFGCATPPGPSLGPGGGDRCGACTTGRSATR